MEKTTKKHTPGIEVERKNNESVGSLSRRFVQKVRKSGILYDVRGRSFYKKKPSKRARRNSALVKVERGKAYQKLRKWGKTK